LNNKNISVKYVGNGVFGKGYKITIDNKSFLLKNFYCKGDISQPHRAGIEPQTGPYANSNAREKQFVKFFFGRAAGSIYNDGFMINEFLEVNTKTATQPKQDNPVIESKPSYVDFVWSGDAEMSTSGSSAHNTINGRVIDFGQFRINGKGINSPELNNPKRRQTYRILAERIYENTRKDGSVEYVMSDSNVKILSEYAKNNLSKAEFDEVMDFYNSKLPADCEVISKLRKISKELYAEKGSAAKDTVAKTEQARQIEISAKLEVMFHNQPILRKELDDLTAPQRKIAEAILTDERIDEYTKILCSQNETAISSAEEEITRVFGSLGKISARPKDFDSSLLKIQKKIIKGIEKNKIKDINDLNTQKLYEFVADGLGTRLVIKPISEDIANKTIQEVLQKHNSTMSISEFRDGLTVRSFKDNPLQREVIERLTKLQTDDFVEKLCAGIEDGRINITELNNYAGEHGIPYLTKEQVEKIRDVHERKYGKGKLKVVDITQGHDDAVKESGYTSAQFNVKYKAEISVDGKNLSGLGEFQARSSHINETAEYEHIAYDGRSGKFTETNHPEIKETLESLNDIKAYNTYNNYLSDNYNYDRLCELGLFSPGVSPKPELPFEITAQLGDRAKFITTEGLKEAEKTAKAVKDAKKKALAQNSG
jgi:hypothetical protein